MSLESKRKQTYTNPVYPHSCPDPFVLKYAGEYWCYFTGIQPDGRCFGILHSRDLVRWQPAGSALDPLPGEHPCYWAPEVTYLNGRFYMYYSVGDEVHMQIRVAVATRPWGPFVDSGHRLTEEEFAIDPHVFVDDDGKRYLFYATDFLNYQRIGTGTVQDLLTNPFTLAGRPRPVTRAGYDWQIYDPHREAKGRVCWHTVEGPFVLKHRGRYYQLFSGGNWQNATYGVSYAVTDELDRDGEWEQHCDGARVLPTLASRPEEGVIGPGHNSVVRGPDNCQLFCIYHRWQPETQERVLAIDRLGWAGDALVVHGPSTGPQPAPASPLLAGFDTARLAAGGWEIREAEAWLTPGSDGAEAHVPLPGEDFVLELSLRTEGGAQNALSVALQDGAGEPFSLAFWQPENGVEIATLTERRRLAGSPGNFDPQAYHLLRLEVQADELAATLDDAGTLRCQGPLGGTPRELVLRTRGGAAVFRGLAVGACPTL